jgi:hypothetical protein
MVLSNRQKEELSVDMACSYASDLRTYELAFSAVSLTLALFCYCHRLLLFAFSLQ